MPKSGVKKPAISMKMAKTAEIRSALAIFPKFGVRPRFLERMSNSNYRGAKKAGMKSRLDGYKALCWDCSAMGLGGLGGADWLHAVNNTCAAARAASILSMLPPALMGTGSP
jgi:hypothetical protein